MKAKLYRGGEPRHVNADVVFATVKLILDAGLEADFLDQCARRKALLAITAKDLNFLKTYLAEHATERKLEEHDPKALMPRILRVARSQPRCDP